MALFVLRVLGQALVAFFDVSFLPSMPHWYSGLMRYEYLLPSQLLFEPNRVLALFVITVGLSHRRRLRR